MQNLGYTYTLKIAVYLKSKFNWAIWWPAFGMVASHGRTEIPEITARQTSKATLGIWGPKHPTHLAHFRDSPLGPEPLRCLQFSLGSWREGLVTKTLLRPWEIFEGLCRSDDK